MKNMAKIPLLFLAAGLAAASSPARADGDGPFDFAPGHWMSFSHYQEADRRGMLTAAPQPPAPPPAPAAPVKPTVAAPARPIDLPVMPALNKGFDMQVTSTADQTGLARALAAAENPPPLTPILDNNWQDPGSVYGAKKTAADDADDGSAPALDVRLSFLPNEKITPMPEPSRVTAQHKARLALEKGLIATRPEQKTPMQNAACQAIDAYKKQQLAAIQSDQRTLKALQEAIASLGLQKQLGFMTGSGSLDLTSAQNTASGKAGLPAAPPALR